MKHQAMLDTVGSRVRALREERSLSRRELSETSGVSERYLGQLESGKGNISLVRFTDVALALGTTPSALLAGATEIPKRSEIVSLLGVRGAGKSTIGPLLARQLERPFIEVDQCIENAAGLSLGQIFELHGESYYRRLETEALHDIINEGTSAVLAAGGSIVNHQENFTLLQNSSRTIWLRAQPEDHWDRVLRQGDQRPMEKNPNAFAELRALLSAREPLYSAADHTVNTSGRSIEEVVDMLSSVLA